MEAYTTAPVRWANRVDVLLNGEQIFPAQVDAIRSAQLTFIYAQYVYETGPPVLLKAMTERYRVGVHEHVDGIGSLAMPMESQGLYLFAISSAHRTIYLTNPYFVPDAGITEALIKVCGRGVQVVLLLPGAIDHEIVEAASRAGFGRLLDAGQ